MSSLCIYMEQLPSGSDFLLLSSHRRGKTYSSSKGSAGNGRGCIRWGVLMEFPFHSFQELHSPFFKVPLRVNTGTCLVFFSSSPSGLGGKSIIHRPLYKLHFPQVPEFCSKTHKSGKSLLKPSDTGFRGLPRPLKLKWVFLLLIAPFPF